MKWLGDKLKDDIADAVLKDLDYSPGRRKAFLGNMLREYRVTLAADTTGEDVQISPYDRPDYIGAVRPYAQ